MKRPKNRGQKRPFFARFFPRLFVKNHYILWFNFSIFLSNHNSASLLPPRHAPRHHYGCQPYAETYPKFRLYAETFLQVRLLSGTYLPFYSASLGQFFTHSIQRIHSVPLALFLELSVTSTFIGHTLLHFPQEIHFSLSHFIRSSEK